MDFISNAFTDILVHIESFIMTVPYQRILGVIVLIFIAVAAVKFAKGVLSIVFSVLGILVLLYVIDPAIYSNVLGWLSQALGWVKSAFI